MGSFRQNAAMVTVGGTGVKRARHAGKVSVGRLKSAMFLRVKLSKVSCAH